MNAWKMKQNMNHKQKAVFAAGLALLGSMALVSTARADIFVYRESDLFLTFRKVAPFTENYETVVNIGQATNYVNAAIGTTNAVAGFSAAQITGSFSSLDYLSLAVMGYRVYPSSSYPNYPAATLWLTVPRADIAVRSSDAVRHSAAQQLNVISAIDNVSGNAGFISRSIGTSGTYNTPTFVRESITIYPNQILTKWIGGIASPNVGTLNDNWIDNNLEITTPDAFTDSGDVVRSDLYEIRPLDDGQGGTVVDPHTGATGLAYYVGYFELRSDGSMVFVREEAAAPLPPQPTLSIARSNSANLISFVSSSGTTYRCFFTNSAGIAKPVANWSSLPSIITGNGSPTNFADMTTDPNRFYRVTAQ
jgi:hypothetical protein